MTEPSRLKEWWLTGLSGRKLPLILLLFVAIAFRFPELGYVRLGYDQSYQTYDALRLLDGRQLLLIGQPSSIFLDNPPLMAYLQAIPLLFWRSPWAVYLFITALNTVAVAFVYWTAREVLGETAAIIAAFLFAVNPWVVHFSRFPWTQGLLPLFTAVAAWGLWPAMTTGRQRPHHVFIGLLAVIAMTQTYILAFAALLPVGLLLFLFYRRLPKWPLYVSAGIFAAGLLLFIAGLQTSPKRNVTKFQDFIEGYEFHFDTEAIEHAARFVTGQDYYGQDELSQETTAPQPPVIAATILLSLAMATGLLRSVVALWQGGQERQLAVILLIWLLLPTLSLALIPYPVHPHYLTLTLPAGHLLATWGILPLFRWSRLRWLCLLTLLLIAVQFRLNLYRAGQAVASAPAGYGFNAWALADAAKVGAAVRELSAGESYPRRIYAADVSPLLSGMSATLVETTRDLAFPDTILLPGQEPLLYVLVNQALPPPAPGLLLEAFPERELQLVDGTRVSFFRVLPYTRERAVGLPQAAVDWTSDAGLTLLGYDLDRVQPLHSGQSLTMTTYWRVEELHLDRLEWFVTSFYHLVNQQGQIVTNVGGHGQWGYNWQSGDIYVERVIIPLPDDAPAGLYQLAFGLFDPIHTLNFYLHAPGGNVPAYMLSVAVE